MNLLQRYAARFGAVLLSLPATSNWAQSVQPANSPAQKSNSSARQEAAQKQKPQVIYNIGNGAREKAEALHSQSKPADTPLPIDGNMPISLQLARSNANAGASESAAQSRQPSAADEGSQSGRKLRQAARTSRSTSNGAKIRHEKSERSPR